jgi:hypothetical protein
MSLTRKRIMNEKQLAAIRRNQTLTHGRVTARGRERIRAAHLRHGFYAQAEEVVLRALGEDPAQFQELLEGLWETYQPADAAQEGLVIQLARATWLMYRADRMQEGLTARQAQMVCSGREDRVHAQMMRLKMTAERLRRLAESVACEHYVTTSADLEKMKALHQEGVVKEMGEIALALFYRLKPGEDEDGPEDYEQARLVVAQIKEIFGIHGREYKIGANGQPIYTQPEDSPPEASAAGGEQNAPPSRFTPEEWEAREQARQLLENILTRLMENCAAQRKTILKESVNGPSPYERAAEIAPNHPNALLMRRMQDSHFREVRRVTNLLLKLKRHQRKMEAPGGNGEV